MYGLFLYKSIKSAASKEGHPNGDANWRLGFSAQGDMIPLVFVTFRPKSGCEARVLQILKTMAVATRREPGNRLYELYRCKVSGGPEQYHLLERYDDDAALQAHRETPHYREYRVAIAPLLEAPIAVSLLESVDANHASGGGG